MSIIDRIKAHNATRPWLKVQLADFLANYAEDGVCIAVVPLVQREIDEATESALEYRKRALKSLPENQHQAFLDDPTVLENAKQIEMVWRACREVEDRSVKAFPTSLMLREQMTSDEIASLIRLYDVAERRASRVPEPMSESQRSGLAALVAASADTDAPDIMLAGLPSEVVSDWAIWMAKRWWNDIGKHAANREP